jgi:hypothetical protein
MFSDSSSSSRVAVDTDGVGGVGCGEAPVEVLLFRPIEQVERMAAIEDSQGLGHLHLVLTGIAASQYVHGQPLVNLPRLLRRHRGHDPGERGPVRSNVVGYLAMRSGVTHKRDHVVEFVAVPREPGLNLLGHGLMVRSQDVHHAA